MKKAFVLFLTLCIFATLGMVSLAEQSTDLSDYDDEALLTLLAEVQTEVAARKIEKTAELTNGSYVGGKNIPAGSYVLTAAGSEKDHGIVYLQSVNDSADEYPSKLYEYTQGDEDFSVFITIEEGDTLCVPFPYTLTISAGVLFK